jgi:hypothetical protein
MRLTIAIKNVFAVFVHLIGERSVIEEITIWATRSITISVTVDSGVAVTQSDTDLVVDPLTNINVETNGGLAPFHGGVTLFI